MCFCRIYMNSCEVIGPSRLMRDHDQIKTAKSVFSYELSLKSPKILSFNVEVIIFLQGLSYDVKFYVSEKTNVKFCSELKLWYTKVWANFVVYMLCGLPYKHFV